MAYQHVDALGYAYCHDCAPGRDGLEFATAPTSEQPCDRCGRVIGSVPVETQAAVMVEYTPCRIF